jgi:homocysteine S-methyltransferase
MPSPTATAVPITILDGGLGTTLKDGYNATVDGKACPLWSSHLLISDPETLVKAQTAFVNAGAQALLSATYQVSFEGFANTKAENAASGAAKGEEGYGYDREAAMGFMRSAIGISRSAFVASGKSNGTVVLGLGAYGAIMVPSQEYTGAYDESHRSVGQLQEWHSERLAVFSADAATWREVDMVAFETVPLVAEIEAVRRSMFALAGRGERKRRFWISCVFPGEGNSVSALPDGTGVREVVRAMLRGEEGSERPSAVGFNCTKIGKAEGLVRAFETAIEELLEEGAVEDWPALVLYPDGTNGEVYNTSTCEWEVKESGGDDVSSFLLPLSLYLLPCWLKID